MSYLRRSGPEITVIPGKQISILFGFAYKGTHTKTPCLTNEGGSRIDAKRISVGMLSGQLKGLEKKEEIRSEKKNKNKEKARYVHFNEDPVTEVRSSSPVSSVSSLAPSPGASTPPPLPDVVFSSPKHSPSHIPIPRIHRHFIPVSTHRHQSPKNPNYRLSHTYPLHLFHPVNTSIPHSSRQACNTTCVTNPPRPTHSYR